ncbi:MAG: hypothetical protein KatS3mg061_1860 [Dehalococcoidia bacterium]|nr:MAG: hypothetical protein KatS3mg061_1860 [Dehalococcoidia bacterium]
MGQGKTEAALVWLERWNARRDSGGYVALPTQATATQLYSRVKKFLEHRFARPLGQEIPLLLVHGAADLVDEVEFFPTQISGEEGQSQQATVATGEWFVPRKRALLAPFGVGTIDQALLAVLMVRHVFVRLFGLAAKPVIIDEVHAYDTYMTTLLERLLEWLGALESPVALLSATLPIARRNALLQAYTAGRWRQRPNPIPAATYPRLTWVDAEGAPHAQSIDDSPKPVRTVRLEPIPDDPAEVATFLAQKLAQKGCAAVICNTVRRAQDLFQALHDHFAEHERGLLHARFLAQDRRDREQRYLRWFGPTGEERPSRFVLVTTQIVEQSLDVDFDLLVSDLAPVDLLFQRLGRLHRHQRKRPPGLEAPLLAVRWPLSRGEEPQFDRGSLAVYDHYVLLRSWWELRNRTSLHLPDDIADLIESVYSEDPTPPATLAGPLQVVWQQSWERLQRTRQAERDQARQARIPDPNREAAPTELLKSPPREETEASVPAGLRAVTRLAEPSLEMVVLRAAQEVDQHLRTAVALAGSKRLDRGLVQALLARAVTISNRRLYRALDQLTPPPAFAATPALYRARLVVVAPDGRPSEPAGLPFRLDPALGVVVERSEDVE